MHSVGRIQLRDRSTIVSVIVPEGIRWVEPRFLENCLQLRKVSLPSTLTEIPKEAFRGCNQLQDVELAEGLAVIRDRAFQDCQALTRISLPQSLEEIREEAFSCCTGLREVRLPRSLRVLDGSAFQGCDSLTDLEPDPASAFFSKAGRFLLNRSGTELVLCLPNQGEEAVVPDGVKEIRPGAFVSCEDITSVILPDSVERIGCDAFAGCNLSSICLGNGLEEIREGAFHDVSVDEQISLTFPASLKAIRSGAFQGFQYEDGVRFLGIPEEMEDHAFDRRLRPAWIQVPKQVPAGSFRNWLHEMESRNIQIRYG